MDFEKRIISINHSLVYYSTEYKDHPICTFSISLPKTEAGIRTIPMMDTLTMVDNKKLGFTQGVDISFLSGDEQQLVLVVLQETDCNISMVQSAKLKEYGKEGELTLPMVRLILTEEKPKERKFTIKQDKINHYFPAKYSSDEIENVILTLLEEWKERQ